MIERITHEIQIHTQLEGNQWQHMIDMELLGRLDLRDSE